MCNYSLTKLMIKGASIGRFLSPPVCIAAQSSPVYKSLGFVANKDGPIRASTQMSRCRKVTAKEAVGVEFGGRCS